MESDRDILAIQRKLAHCRQLAKDFPDGPTAKHIRELEDQLRADLAAELHNTATGRPTAGRNSTSAPTLAPHAQRDRNSLLVIGCRLRAGVQLGGYRVPSLMKEKLNKLRPP